MRCPVAFSGADGPTEAAPRRSRREEVDERVPDHTFHLHAASQLAEDLQCVTEPPKAGDLISEDEKVMPRNRVSA